MSFFLYHGSYLVPPHPSSAYAFLLLSLFSEVSRGSFNSSNTQIIRSRLRTAETKADMTSTSGTDSLTRRLCGMIWKGVSHTHESTLPARFYDDLCHIRTESRTLPSSSLLCEDASIPSPIYFFFHEVYILGVDDNIFWIEKGHISDGYRHVSLTLSSYFNPSSSFPSTFGQWIDYSEF